MSKSKAAPNPCGTCPYRKDVPSGIWDPSEYLKLPQYDRPTSLQPPGVFMCHQQDGSLCAGWLACHDRDELLALRIAGGQLDPGVWDYETETPVFESGLDACLHGLAEVASPGEVALRRIRALEHKQAVKAVFDRGLDER